ncbi:MAG: NapC/NirT family cytochrome c [Acidobacteriota bacterium]
MPIRWLGPLLKLLGTNWITLFGANLTTVSAVVILGFLLLGSFGLVDSPYIALMSLLVLPGVFVFGLLLIPVGLWVQRRKERKYGKAAADERPFPVIDFNSTAVRRIAASVALLTLFNLLLISLVSYEGVAYMDSTEFCGQVCHTVMEPEFTAYQGSPHSRVECVECHIGPGAPWFVRSKLSGLGQVVAVTLHTYETPIPTPVANLRPSQDTCEQCHWPERFTGDRVRIITRFAEDEANTPERTVLVMHIGGGGREQGIHSWHINPNRETYFVASDPQRQNIVWVQVREGDKVTEYVAEGAEIDRSSLDVQKRRMDCIDCHNRPTHIYRLPADAMDRALAAGEIDRSLPYIKKMGTQILTEVGENLGEAEEVSRRLLEYYRENYPELANTRRESIEAAAAVVEGIYRRNVFPKMKVTWGTYPDHLGHENFPGCFRCHDGSHSTADGEIIVMDCDTCHTMLDNPEVISALQLE